MLLYVCSFNEIVLGVQGSMGLRGEKGYAGVQGPQVLLDLKEYLVYQVWSMYIENYCYHRMESKDSVTSAVAHKLNSSSSTLFSILTLKLL